MILVPLLIGYLNTVKYGIWVTIFSVINWFYLFDIGLGNGLRNKLAEALAKDEKEIAKIYISKYKFVFLAYNQREYYLAFQLEPTLYRTWPKA